MDGLVNVSEEQVDCYVKAIYIYLTYYIGISKDGVANLEIEKRFIQ